MFKRELVRFSILRRLGVKKVDFKSFILDEGSFFVLNLLNRKGFK